MRKGIKSGVGGGVALASVTEMLAAPRAPQVPERHGLMLWLLLAPGQGPLGERARKWNSNLSM